MHLLDIFFLRNKVLPKPSTKKEIAFDCSYWNSVNIVTVFGQWRVGKDAAWGWMEMGDCRMDFDACKNGIGCL
jgi:hypothetical protein